MKTSIFQGLEGVGEVILRTRPRAGLLVRLNMRLRDVFRQRLTPRWRLGVFWYVIVPMLLPVWGGEGLTQPLPTPRANLGSGAAESDADVEELQPVQPYDLRSYFVDPENRDWMTEAGWKPMPRGHTNLCGLDFRFDGLIQVAGKRSRKDMREFRERVSFHVGGKELGAVHLVGGTAWSDETGAQVATLVWRYTDGSHMRVAVRYAHQVRDIWRMRYEDPARVLDQGAKVVWKGEADESVGPERSRRLYKFTIKNLQNEKAVEWIELYAGDSEASLLLAAMSVDPLTERDCDCEDQEEEDPYMSGRLEVTVIAEESGYPVRNARVQIFGWYPTEKGNTRLLRGLRTGTNGVALLKYPEVKFHDLRVTVQAEGHAEMHTVLPSERGLIPEKFVVRLPGAARIGGVVLDESGKAIAGAQLILTDRSTAGEMASKVETVEARTKSSVSMKTDGEGKWSTTELKPGKAGEYFLRIAHKDYQPPLYIKITESDFQQMLGMTHEIRLMDGTEFSGQVMGLDSVPVEGAIVRVGQLYTNGSRPAVSEARTDADGRFRVRGIKPDPGHELPSVPATASDVTTHIVRFKKLIGIQADGFEPMEEALEFSSNVVEREFQLKKGRSLRCIVVDEEGLPVSGVSVRYDPLTHGPTGPPLAQWNSLTDAEGRFEWKGVPEGKLRLSFSKTGLSAVRKLPLEAGEIEQRIVMHPVRKVRGRVIEKGTGTPVQSFYITSGAHYQRTSADEPRFSQNGSSGDKHYSHENGEFELTLHGEASTALHVRSDAHAARVYVLPKGEAREIEVTVELERTSQFRGWIVDSEDQPVAGARVLLIDEKPQFRIDMESGKTRWRGPTTDAEGNFNVGGLLNPQKLLVLHESGSAEVPAPPGGAEEMRIALQGWGRIEGVVRLNDEPVEGYKVALQSDTTRQGGVESDENGVFTFEHLPSGRYEVIRDTRMDEWSGRYTYTRQMVDVRSGETSPVELDLSGAILGGQVRLPDSVGPGHGGSLHGMLTLQRDPPFFSTAEERRAWSNSAAGREWQRGHQAYGVKFDGEVFTSEPIPPGRYSLEVRLRDPSPVAYFEPRIPLAQVTREVVVLDGAPIDLGEIQLQAVERPGRGRSDN